MANKTNVIYEIVRSHDGIKCLAIASTMHESMNVVSGILSMLKYRGSIFNEDAKWYATNSVHTVKHILDDIHESLDVPFGGWAEGYVSALADHNVINEDEFDELIEYIKNK